MQLTYLHSVLLKQTSRLVCVNFQMEQHAIHLFQDETH